MKNKKSIFLLIFIFLLVGASLYLVYVIQDGSNPLATLNLRAAVDEFGNEFTDNEPFDEDTGDPLLAQNTTETPTPTIEYNSTSPTPEGSITPSVSQAVSGSPTPTITTAPATTGTVSPSPSLTPTLTPTPTPSPSPTKVPTPTPLTTITQLPVAGVSDYFNPVVMTAGAGVLIILALFL